MPSAEQIVVSGGFDDIRSPWSGHYIVNPALWAYAHYGQFCKIGWRYLDGGCTNLADGNGKCLRQVIFTPAQNWAPEWMPYTIFGDRDWKDYEASADLMLDGGGWAGVLGRFNGTGSGWGCNPKGYYARLAQDGTVSIWVANSPRNGEPGKQLATGNLADFKPEKWHNLKLRFAGTNISALVDDAEVATATDGTYASGMAGLVSGGEKNTRNTALYDNVIINPVGVSKPEPTILSQAVIPMYQTGMTAAQVNAVAHQKAIAVTTKTSSAEAASHSQAARLAAKYLDRFTSGSMAAKQAWDLASASINAGNLNAALATLEEIRARDDLTPEQITAVTETIAAIRNSSSPR